MEAIIAMDATRMDRTNRFIVFLVLSMFSFNLVIVEI